MVLEGYYDANWLFNIEDSKYTSGNIFIIVGEVVLWKSMKQTCIA